MDDFHERCGDQRQPATAAGASEHRQYRLLRDAADDRDANESGSVEAEIADRHQLQYCGGSRRQSLKAAVAEGFRPSLSLRSCAQAVRSVARGPVGVSLVRSRVWK